MKQKPLTIQQKILFKKGLAFHQDGRIAQAIAIYEQLNKVQPGNLDILGLLAMALSQCGNHVDALQLMSRSLEIFPQQPELINNQAAALHALKRFDESLACCEKALAMKADYAEAYNNRGNALRGLRRFEEALASFDRALAIRPGFPEAHGNRGVVLADLFRFEEALESFNFLLTMAPQNVEALVNRANTLVALERCEEALSDYARAIAQNPGYAQAYYNNANALIELRCYDEALVRYEQAAAHGGGMLDLLPGKVLHARMHLSDWRDYDAHIAQLVQSISDRCRVSSPFALSAALDDGKVLRQCAELYAQDYLRGDTPNVAPAPRPRHTAIRIGYFSSDFGDHPVSHLLAGMLEHHDKAKFEVYAFSLKRRDDPWRTRIARCVDHWIDVDTLSARAIADRARTLEIDIAVDLNGYTEHARTEIFAERAAPIQVSYIGYIGTSGAPFMDYILADAVLVPPEAREDFSEKIAYLPSYQSNDDTQAIAVRSMQRAEAGLPEDGFVFCSFNKNYKITPVVFDAWMRILRQVDRSVLWLFADNETAIAHLRQEAEKRGVSSDRLIFAGRVSLEDHMARQRLADLFLDTHPYNAGATASNALRMGLPVLTYLGTSMVSRMGASLLTAVALPELIAESWAQYESIALSLATQPERLAEVRAKLAQTLPGARLFDTERFTRSLESVFVAMYERQQNGLPPASIEADEAR